MPDPEQLLQEGCARQVYPSGGCWNLPGSPRPAHSCALGARWAAPPGGQSSDLVHETFLVPLSLRNTDERKGLSAYLDFIPVHPYIHLPRGHTP